MTGSCITMPLSLQHNASTSISRLIFFTDPGPITVKCQPKLCSTNISREQEGWSPAPHHVQQPAFSVRTRRSSVATVDHAQSVRPNICPASTSAPRYQRHAAMPGCGRLLADQEGTFHSSTTSIRLVCCFHSFLQCLRILSHRSLSASTVKMTTICFCRRIADVQ